MWNLEFTCDTFFPRKQVVSKREKQDASNKGYPELPDAKHKGGNIKGGKVKIKDTYRRHVVYTNLGLISKVIRVINTYL